MSIQYIFSRYYTRFYGQQPGKENFKPNQGFLLVIVLIAFAVYLSVPLWDIDLWYHLATGKYIFEHKALLSNDPFSYTTGQVSSSEMVNLRGYWLSQLFFYFVYSTLGNYGLIILRVTLLLLSLSTIFIIGRKIKSDDSCLLIFLVLAGLALRDFTGERPQLFSFLLAPVVFYLLHDLKNKYEKSSITAKSFMPLPLVILLWANLHRGFIMGAALIILFGISEAIRLSFKKKLDRSFLTACIIMVIGLSASLINPNTYKPYIDVVTFEGSSLQQRISEYMSPVTLAIEYRQVLPFYWLYLLFFFIILGLSIKTTPKTQLITMLFMAAISLSAFRYIPFFLLITAPYTAFHLSEIIKKKAALRIITYVFAYATFLLILIFAFTGFNSSLGNTCKSSLQEHRFPEGAVEFTLRNRPSGNVFNTFNWGGYLIWRLYPKYKIFIDSRTLSTRTFSDYTYILWDRNRSKHLIDSYGINIIIMSGLSQFSGELYELTDFLYEDADWNLVYQDDTAMVFLRGIENKNLISQFSMPKTEIYSHVIVMANNLLHSGLNNHHAWNALYKAYTAKGMNDYAEKARRITTDLR